MSALAKLTAQQQAIATFDGRHAVVSAVAGSGKSTTLLARIEHLLAAGADPARILVLMFNQSASAQFSARLGGALRGRRPEVFTFHAFGLRLRSRLEQQGVLPARTLLTDEGKLAGLAREALAASLGKRPGTLDPEDVREFIEAVEKAKIQLVAPESAAAPPGMRQLQDQLERAAAITFTDLVYEPARLLAQQPDLARLLGNRYDHILVDEAQDVAPAQRVLLRALAGERARVMAVGDEDQSIYAFRGASPAYLVREFFEDFPGAVRLTLSQTFRYGHALALAANAVISNNVERTPKLSVACGKPTRIDRVAVPAGKSTGEPVARALAAWRQEGRALAECVILVRNFAQTMPVELYLLRHSVPYRIAGGGSFVFREECLHLMAVLLLCDNWIESVQDKALQERIVHALLMGLYLPARDRRSLVARIVERPLDFIRILEHYAHGGAFAESWQKTRFLEAVERFEALMDTSENRLAAAVLEEYFRNAKLLEMLEKSTRRPEVARDRILLCRELVEVARGSRMVVRSFVDWLLTLPARLAERAQDQDAVLLTSCHRSKGLEYAHVILPDLQDVRWPAAGGDEVDLEDERRLFYVAMTRAAERLTLVHPADSALERALLSPRPSMPEAPQASRFLYEARLTEAITLGEKLHTGQTVTATAPHLAAYLAQIRTIPAPKAPSGARARKRQTAP